MWLQSLDLSILRLVRETLRNPFFDWLMPPLSGNGFFAPAVLIGAVLLAWKGRLRGRVCLVMLALVVFLGDTFICGPLKDAIGRERPPGLNAAEYNLPLTPSSSHSMPSSHAANWFAATTVAFLYYRRSLVVMLPLALAVSYSRLYKGAHYPSDVLAGALLGTCYAMALVWLVDWIWRRAGRRWFPLWYAALPSVRKVDNGERRSGASVSPAFGGVSPPLRFAGGTPGRAGEAPAPLRWPDGVSLEDRQWLRLGYVLIALLLLARLGYLASGRIELGIDEAYQWIWSKHLALSYYSKPPLIAFAQRLGTLLWGDTAFGVRFLSPVSAAIVSLLLLRFLARHGFVRAGFWLVPVSAATPLLETGATVLTVDCLLVLFWTAAMVSGWRALERNSVRVWLWTGLMLGFGCLSKYTALFQIVCLGIFFALWKPARIHLRRPGPYLAVGLALLCTLPVWIWNAQHDWITLTHVATNARVDRPWKPSLNYIFDFTVAEFALLNPFFFIGASWAAVAFWRHEPQFLRSRRREEADLRDPAILPPPYVGGYGGYEGFASGLPVYLFGMGTPLFLGYWLYALHSKVQPNWIAASITPLFCLMTLFWESRYRGGISAVKGWLAAALSVGLLTVLVMHDTNIAARVFRHPLPPQKDPLRQVRAWPETARAVNEARQKLLAEGRPAFIICAHYGMTGELSFYLPEAKAGVPDHPLVYYQSSDSPENQFFFWPGYRSRKGENAIYVVETDEPHPAPERLRREFGEVRDLGIKEILYRGQVFRRLQLFECRDLQ